MDHVVVVELHDRDVRVIRVLRVLTALLPRKKKQLDLDLPVDL